MSLNKKLDICQYICHINNNSMTPIICANESKKGHINCLKYLYENGYKWDEYTCSFAAKYGHIDCLVYAHENGCKWSVWTTRYAAKYGKLDCLIYAHEKWL